MDHEYTEEQREAEQAMVFLDTWGSTTYPPTPWKRWKYSEDGAPEFLGSDDLDGEESDNCVTVLHCGLSDPKLPMGYRELWQGQCGERQCPGCDGTGHAHNHDTGEHDQALGPCPLCEGNRYIYWGEEWSVLVLGPAIVVGAGQAGCMYDFGPERYTSRRSAWTSVRDSLEHVGLSRRTLARVARDLCSQGVHYFDRRLRPFVGWDYVEMGKP